MAGRTDNRNYKFEETDQYSSVDTFELLRYGVETCNIPMIDMKLRIGMKYLLQINSICLRFEPLWEEIWCLYGIFPWRNCLVKTLVH